MLRRDNKFLIAVCIELLKQLLRASGVMLLQALTVSVNIMGKKKKVL